MYIQNCMGSIVVYKCKFPLLRSVRQVVIWVGRFVIISQERQKLHFHAPVRALAIFRPWHLKIAIETGILWASLVYFVVPVILLYKFKFLKLEPRSRPKCIIGSHLFLKRPTYIKLDTGMC